MKNLGNISIFNINFMYLLLILKKEWHMEVFKFLEKLVNSWKITTIIIWGSYFLINILYILSLKKKSIKKSYMLTLNSILIFINSVYVGFVVISLLISYIIFGGQ